MSILLVLLGIVGLCVGIGSLVCGIMVLVKQFQTDGPLHGIIGIVTCLLWTLIWGWINATKLNIKKLMMIWSALIVVGLGIQGITAVVAGGAAAKEMQRQMELQQQQRGQ